MKRLILILVIILLPAMLFSQGNMEKGKRYLKLGMTYLQAGNMDQAGKYIDEGYNLVSNTPQPDVYWSAVGSEYKGYLAQRNGDEDEANKYFDLAIKTYKKIIKQKDGSPVAVAELKNNIENIEYSKEKMHDGMEEPIVKPQDFPESKDEDFAPSGMNNNDFSKYAAGNKVLNYDRSKFDEVFYQIPKNVENLSMANSKVKDLYPFYDFTKLNYLNLSDNGIKTIPPGLSKLKNLKYLSLNNNKIKKLPVAEFGALKSLKVLDLRNNKVTSGEMFQLVRQLPNTNILMDEYQKVEEEEEGTQPE